MKLTYTGPRSLTNYTSTKSPTLPIGLNKGIDFKLLQILCSLSAEFPFANNTKSSEDTRSQYYFRIPKNSNFDVDNKRYFTKREIEYLCSRITNACDGSEHIIAENKELLSFIVAETEDEIMREISEELDFYWRNYVDEDPCSLSAEAIDLRALLESILNKV